MELKKQVTSLELSKRLKELNCRQESLWYWIKRNSQEKIGEVYFSLEMIDLRLRDNSSSWIKENAYSAFTCAELGEKLSKIVPDTNCRAKMLIWLIENKYVNVEDLR